MFRARDMNCSKEVRRIHEKLLLAGPQCYDHHFCQAKPIESAYTDHITRTHGALHGGVGHYGVLPSPSSAIMSFSTLLHHGERQGLLCHWLPLLYSPQPFQDVITSEQTRCHPLLL